MGRLATICLSVYVWMCPSQVPEWLDGFYSYSHFKSCICYRSVPGEYELSSSKLGTLQMSPRTRNGDFLENGPDEFDKISLIYGD
jgi:hypothetical protein